MITEPGDLKAADLIGNNMGGKGKKKGKGGGPRRKPGGRGKSNGGGSSEGTPTADPAAMASPTFPPGSRVILHGLVARPELNGREGMVLPKTATSDRTPVRLFEPTGRSYDSSAPILLKPSNISLAKVHTTSSAAAARDSQSSNVPKADFLSSASARHAWATERDNTDLPSQQLHSSYIAYKHATARALSWLKRAVGERRVRGGFANVRLITESAKKAVARNVTMPMKIFNSFVTAVRLRDQHRQWYSKVGGDNESFRSHVHFLDTLKGVVKMFSGSVDRDAPGTSQAGPSAEASGPAEEVQNVENRFASLAVSLERELFVDGEEGPADDNAET